MAQVLGESPCSRRVLPVAQLPALNDMAELNHEGVDLERERVPWHEERFLRI